MERSIRKKAWKKVKAIKRFYYHAGCYGILAVFFFLMNMVTDPFDMWFFYPLIPWGAMLSFHYLVVFGIPGTNILTKEWEEREFERQIDKLEEGEGYYSGFETRKGNYLEYTELSDEDALELRRLQKVKKGGDRDRFFGEDFV